VATRRQQAHTQTQRQDLRDLSILKEIAEALNGATNVDQALRDSLARVADLLGLHTGWVWLIDQQTGHFYSATAQALPPFLRDPVQMTGKSCWCIEAYRSGQLTAENIDVIECSRLRAALRPDARQPETRGLRYHASIPLNFGDRQLGIMNVATPTWRRLTRRELDLLSTIASQLGMAIERARLAEESVRVARLEERARLARDLHDTLTQGLTAIGLHIEAGMTAVAAMAAARGVDDGAAREELERALKVTRASLEEARQSLRELRSSPLNGRPLAEALVAVGREMASTTGVRVYVRSASAEKIVLPPQVEEELYRIATEALTNVRRHAEANEVQVTLTRSGRSARLVIADDGRGFDLRKTNKRTAGASTAGAGAGGYGLAGMRERAALIGGRFLVRSRPGRGTHITVVVPLDDAQHVQSARSLQSTRRARTARSART
jgi:two-component system NarL family sensor kinase